MTNLSANDIKQLHKKYAPSKDAYDMVYTHCLIVWEIAKQLIEKQNLEVDKELVRAGCLLHDIGVYKLYKPNGQFYEPKTYLSHGLISQEILESEGLDKQICSLVSVHTGMGITKEEITKNHLPLPPKNYMPRTKEERLVMYADKFHSKDSPPHFNSIEWFKDHIGRYGEDKIKLFQSMTSEFGEPDLKTMALHYSQQIL